MGRCGCSSDCSCSVVAGDGVTVEGNGQPGTPYVVSTGGGEFCAQVGSCVCTMATTGTGIDCTPASLSVLPSSDAGNVIVNGSDGRLYAGDTPEPPPPTPPPIVQFQQSQSLGPNDLSLAALALHDQAGAFNWHLDGPDTLVLEDAGWYEFDWNAEYAPNNSGIRFSTLTADGDSISGDQGTAMAFFPTLLSGGQARNLPADAEATLSVFQTGTATITVTSILTVKYLGTP